MNSFLLVCDVFWKNPCPGKKCFEIIWPLAYLKRLENCLFLFHLFTAVVGSCSQPNLKNENSCKCLKVSSQITRYFYFQLCLPSRDPGLPDFINLKSQHFIFDWIWSYLQSVMATDMHHLNRMKRYKFWRWDSATLTMKNR